MPALMLAAAIEYSEPAQGNFSQHFLLPARDRMGKPLGLTLHPCPGGYLGLTPPCLLVLKIVPSLTELSIFQPPCTENGSHIVGAHHAGRARKKNQHPRDTQCGSLMTLIPLDK